MEDQSVHIQRRTMYFMWKTIQKVTRKSFIIIATVCLIFSTAIVAQKSVDRPRSVNNIPDCREKLANAEVITYLPRPDGRKHNQLIWTFCDGTTVFETRKDVEELNDFEDTFRKATVGAVKQSVRELADFLGVGSTTEYMFVKESNGSTTWIMILRGSNRTFVFESRSLLHILFMRSTVGPCSDEARKYPMPTLPKP